MTRDATSFDALYKAEPDPWNYETSAYEAEKYRRCLALLPRCRYPRGLEIGCSIGVMSAEIAQRCDSLLALDFAQTAVARARARGIPNARFEVATIPAEWPAGRWDLIVLSEVLYYLGPAELDRTVTLVAKSLAAGGCCLVAGYTGPTETTLSALDVQDRLLHGLAEAHPRHAIYKDRDASWIAAIFECRTCPAGG
ncbi:nodulation S family protein [Paracoccus sp. YLB-12]|uniref:Nodulation S family protein n=1 Tax=Paracoccus maritimus TaxID=2933292 RepID=A0ABT2KA50_9RHOB|nr:class I SAM-dependent methyltransferase [Paracoccus sp. YLB-12]MCT4333148.1 nodulation S family protein [Paracoccus sp. YLB-12]